MLEVIGTSIAILHDTSVVVILRDNNSNIAYANRWDLPGGQREPHERPVACGLNWRWPAGAFIGATAPTTDSD